MKQKKIVYVVHSVDTEGPLYESLKETFLRVENVFGLKFRPSYDLLKQLQNREVDLNGLEEHVSRMLAPQLINYNDNYAKLDAMLERIGSHAFRHKHTDSFGGGWIYNWHCVDHVGYNTNPRRKDIGFHNIYDHYKDFIDQSGAPDKLYWHYHPSHPRGASNLNATAYFIDRKIFEILSRRIIERMWFPSVNRAGFHAERPDSHWFLEQWIPFDLSNQAFPDDIEQPDLANGRFGDWRRSPDDWSIYHPDHDDYQISGNCRRTIGRCLNVGTRIRCITQEEVDRAFYHAQQNGASLLGVTNHDFREMEGDIDLVRSFLKNSAQRYEDVAFKFSDAREAFNQVLYGKYEKPTKDILISKIKKTQNKDEWVLHVESEEPIFGPQPYLSIRTLDDVFHHDNFDIHIPFRKWSYTFDFQTHILDSLRSIGIATNDKHGNCYIHVSDVNNGKLTTRKAII